MGEFTIGMPLKLGGWIATAVVAASVGAMGVAAGLEFSPGGAHAMIAADVGRYLQTLD
jgi:hypothetical protein